MMVVYQDNCLKSILNELKPAVTDKQLYYLLENITGNPEHLKAQFAGTSKGTITVELVTAKVPVIVSESDIDDFPVNGKIAMFCAAYETAHSVKYKPSAADAGKMKALTASAQELEVLINLYMKSKEWYLQPKSIANFIKKYNEVRALAVAKPAVKTYPLPYDPEYFAKLDMMQQRAYWAYLRENGYVFQQNAGRPDKWVKAEFI